jgi:hypothetical protein
MPCCCGGNGCSCGDPPVRRNYPSSVTVTLELGAVRTGQSLSAIYLNHPVLGVGCCSGTAEMQSAVNGTYVLYPVDYETGRYVLPGYLSLLWSCGSGNLILGGDRCLAFHGEAQSTSCPSSGGDIYCVGRWAFGPRGINGTCEQTSYTFASSGGMIQYAFSTSFTTCPTSVFFEIRREFAYSGTVTGNF